MWWFVAAAAAAETAWPEGDRLADLVHEHPDAPEVRAFVAHHGLRKQKNAWRELAAKGEGVCVAANEYGVSSVWLHDDLAGNGDCVGGRYTGALPYGLSWGMSQSKVIALLGPGAQEDGMVWAIGFDRFLCARFRDDALYGVELSDDGWVSTDLVPRLESDPDLWVPATRHLAPGAGLPTGAPPTGRAAGDALITLLNQPEGKIEGLAQAYGLQPVEGSSWRAAAGPGICLDVYGGRVIELQLQDDGVGTRICPAGRFEGLLPLGLTWGMTQAEVQARLGRGHADHGSLYWDAGRDRFVQATFDDAGGLSALNVAASVTVLPAVLDAVLRGGAPLRLATPPAARAPAVASSPAPSTTPSPTPDGSAATAPPALPRFDAPARTGAKASDASAIVVGLESYPFLGSGVPYANRDAQAMADLLVYTVGVPQGRVQVLTHGAREQILAAVDRAASETPAGGTVWVYFSGHGAANPQTGDRMLLGDDVRSDAVAFAARGVGVREIEERLGAKGLNARLILDACYAGASRSGASILGGTRFAVPMYAAAPTARATEWNAAGPDQISGPLPAAEHGAFTYFAVGALRGWADGELDGARDGAITAAEAQAFVSRALRVHGRNDQTPVWVGADDVVLSRGMEPSPVK